MSCREPVDPSRVRKLPKPFAWVDPRLRDHLQNLTLTEISVLFFLNLAADPYGCSFWSDRTLARRLGMSEGTVVEARLGLMRKGFILYRYPLYQLLALEDSP